MHNSKTCFTFDRTFNLTKNEKFNFINNGQYIGSYRKETDTLLFYPGSDLFYNFVFNRRSSSIIMSELKDNDLKEENRFNNYKKEILSLDKSRFNEVKTWLKKAGIDSQVSMFELSELNLIADRIYYHQQ